MTALTNPRLKDTIGWDLCWTGPYLDQFVERLALNAKVANPGQDGHSRMVAASYGSCVHLWHLTAGNGSQQCTREIGQLGQVLEKLLRIETGLLHGKDISCQGG